MARYRRHGRLDVSFGDDGKITTRFWSRPAVAFAVVIQLNGKIVMAGGGGRLARSKFALARYRPGGKLDPTFGRGGRVTTQFAAGPATALTLAAVAGGKIGAAGEAGGRFALARYFLHPA